MNPKAIRDAAELGAHIAGIIKVKKDRDMKRTMEGMVNGVMRHMVSPAGAPGLAKAAARAAALGVPKALKAKRRVK